MENNDEMELAAINMKLPISSNRFVTYKMENGEHMIYVGEMDMTSESYLMEKNIGFTLTQWATLIMFVDSIDRAIVEIQNGYVQERLFRHIGSNKYVTVTAKYGVDLRNFYYVYKLNDIRPRRKGITLTFVQWNELKHVIKYVPTFIQEMNETVPCIMREDHANQIGYWNCSNCNPNNFNM